MLRPYHGARLRLDVALVSALADHDDPVHVVWHDNERVQRNGMEMFGNLTPTPMRDESSRTEAHPPVHDLPEKGDTPSYANSHEVPPRMRVIEALKPQ